MNTKDFAIKCLQRDISVIPITKNKIPIGNWKKFQDVKMSENLVKDFFIGNTYVGWLTGYNNLFLIDIDEKYTPLDYSIKEKYLAALPKELLDKMLVVETKSGGLHLWYRTPEMSGNEKLAQRETTMEEVMETYHYEIAKGTRPKKAKKIALNDKCRVLIETRGKGGMGASYTTPGYKILSGKIGDLTTEEHSTVLQIAKEMCEFYSPAPEKIKGNYNSDIWNNYNDNVDFTTLLTGNGWECVGENSDRIHFKRPGGTKAKFSANFHKDLRMFRVFSTSTEFDTDKGYSPLSVFLKLECNNNTQVAYKKLVELGYNK